MTGKAGLLWLDLEMTGLDARHDRILEVGAIATNWKLEEIARYESAVRVSPRFIKKRMTGEFWEANHEVRDRLIKLSRHGKSSTEVENDLLEFVKRNFNTKQPIYLAGNSVWNDRRFVEAQWPRLIEKIHYRMLDVSAWKVVFENMFGSKFAKTEDHRAIDDIEGSIAELKQYLGKIKK